VATNSAYPYAVLEVSDALWSEAARIHLSARQVGAVIDILRVAEDHSLHRFGRGVCQICKSYEKLQRATKDARGG